MSYSTVLVEKTDGVALVTLNRPDKKNAMNPQLHEDMTAALEDLRYGFRRDELGEDPGLKLVDDEIGLRRHAFQGECSADILPAEKVGIALEIFRREEAIGVLVHAPKESGRKWSPDQPIVHHEHDLVLERLGEEPEPGFLGDAAAVVIEFAAHEQNGDRCALAADRRQSARARTQG